MKKLILVINFFLITSLAPAEDLLTVYQQALRNDPSYSETINQNKVLKSQFKIDRATVLPTVGIDSSASSSRVSGINFHTYSTTVNLQQTLFNYSDWLTLKADKLSMKQADFNNEAGKQELSLRLTQAYLDLAKQQEIITFDKKKLALTKKLWQQTQLFFKAGAKTDVDVTESQSAYNQSQSILLSDQIFLNDDRATLASITGHFVKSVKTLEDNFPYLLPIPLNESAWIDKVAFHNKFVLADQANMNASHEKIKAQAANYLPTVTTNLGYGYSQQKTDVYSASGSGPTISLNLNIPIYQGGLVSSMVEQSHYQYLASFDKMQVDKENFITQTRHSFISIIQGIEELKTTKKLIAINQKNYQETYFAYIGGIRNANDVTASLNNFYQAQLGYLQAKYQYAESIIQLRYAVGNLSEIDLEKLNAWLV